MRICGVVQARDTEHAVSDIMILNETADLIEIRLDYREEELDLSVIRRNSKLPLIATNRGHEQGGRSRRKGRERLEILLRASEEGFQYVDMEISTPEAGKAVSSVHRNGSKAILSHHDFAGTPSTLELERLFKEGEKKGADLVKLVGTATRVEDNLIYLDFNCRHPGNIFFGMGAAGVVSRVISPLLGGAFTYASVEEGKKSAPGQLTVSELRSVYRLLEGDY